MCAIVTHIFSNNKGLTIYLSTVQQISRMNLNQNVDHFKETI